ncbi:hypothetical protein LTR53_014766, partial [Teratosphaeriaceae sp. CCFEE 6253]
NFALHPRALEDSHLTGSMPRHTVQYCVSATESWLRWDEPTRSIRGVVPQQRALDEGAARLDAYTFPLYLAAVLTQEFPGGVKLERVLRCAIPLTVKRRPNGCGAEAERVLSPPLRARASQPLMDWGGNGWLAGGGKMDGRTVRARVPAAKERGLLSVPHRGQSVRAFSASGEDKENTCEDASMGMSMSMKEVVDHLQRKAECGGGAARASPPLRMDALSLARLYEGVGPAGSLESRAGSPTSPMSASTVRWASRNPYRAIVSDESYGEVL